jgi:hypothetical protein
VAILSPEYVSQYRAGMLAEALIIKNSIRAVYWLSSITPPGAKVAYKDPNEMKCLTCNNTWHVYQPQGASPPGQTLLGTQSVLKPRTASNPWAASSRGALIRPTPPPARNINVKNYHLLGVKDEQQIETVLRTDTKPYSNPTSGTLTPKVIITESVMESVTFETNKIKTSGGQAGVQILGFANIQGQIQQQLNQRYARQIQRTLTVSEEIQIEVPPHTAIEFSIIWKMVWLKGTAILGQVFGTDRVEVPYTTPYRLTFEPRPRNVPLT